MHSDAEITTADLVGTQLVRLVRLLERKQAQYHADHPDAVERATGVRPSLPARVGDLFQREERYVTLPATFDAITAYIADRAKPSA